MSKPAIVTCFPLTDDLVRQIEQAFTGYEVIVSGQSQIADDIHRADIFCGHAKVPVDWDSVVGSGKLKWIQSSAAGLDHCLTPPVIDSPIEVSGCSGLFAPQVAEQTLALLFGLIRSMPMFASQQQQRSFVRQPTADFYGSTVGILGFGGNGARIASVLRPLAGRILATDLFADQQRNDPERHSLADEIHPPESTLDVVARCDVVIVTLPLTGQTERTVDARLFNAMPEGSWFINVGRGGLVDQEALVDALGSGHLAGAGLDVCEPEPLPVDNPLWQLDNVLITPHVGAQSRNRVPATVRLLIDNFRLRGAGQTMKNLVDKKLGFPRFENRLKWKEVDNLINSTNPPK